MKSESLRTDCLTHRPSSSLVGHFPDTGKYFSGEQFTLKKKTRLFRLFSFIISMELIASHVCFPQSFHYARKTQ